MSDPILLAAIDIDGTLMTPEGELTARNARAIRQASQAGVQIVLATGKTRASAEHLFHELGLETPGVFNQGLVIYDGNGSVLRETSFDRETAAAIIRFAEARSLPYFAYSGTRMLTPADSVFRQRLHHLYDEPLPEVVDSVLPYLDDVPVNKFIVCDPVDDGQVRTALANLCAGQAHVTQAVSQFIEVLPPGTSKGGGLAWLLNYLGVPPRQVMAIGDGENDLEMLQLAGLGVAVANAHQRVKAVADFVVASNRESGVAQAIDRFILRTSAGPR